MLSRRLNAFIDGNDQLICLFYSELSLSIDYSLHARLDEQMLKLIEVLKVVLFVDEVMLK
jgi:hypothetical protein